MTPAQIERLLRLVYGNQYATPAAKEIGVSRQTIVGWVNGDWKPDDTRITRLKAIAAKNVIDIARAAKSLGKAP